VADGPQPAIGFNHEKYFDLWYNQINIKRTTLGCCGGALITIALFILNF
jgi:hypothetical protein